MLDLTFGGVRSIPFLTICSTCSPALFSGGLTANTTANLFLLCRMRHSRNSLATGMLGRGASLAEIGELLRHRSPQTTTIYAKVDLGSLRPLALPWPGGEL